MREKEHLVKYKMLFTVIVLLIYIVGKNIPLYMIDLSAYLHKTMDTEAMIMQMVTGDIFQCSIFALGISPILVSTIIVQILFAIKKSSSKSKMSPKRSNQCSLVMTIVLSTILAIVQVDNLVYRENVGSLYLCKMIGVVEMVTGVMIILWLVSLNKRYGIGGQTIFIFANILDGIVISLKDSKLEEMALPLVISFVGMIIMLIMENSEMRIPLQRISIHNIFADKNYMAIKLHPIGVMPAMFAAAFFILPQILVELLLWVKPYDEKLFWIKENLNLSRPLGIAVYVLFIYLLTIVLSRLFINPKDITEQFLKGGDSLVDIHAGKETRKYLSRTINFLSFISATVMVICVGIPVIIQNLGWMQGSVSTLPSSIMIIAGLWCNIYREIVAVRDLEAYEPFI